MDSWETFLPSFLPPSPYPRRTPWQPSGNTTKKVRNECAFIFTLKNSLVELTRENNPFDCHNKWEQKAESEKAALKQKTFHKKCELISLTGVFFLDQVYLCWWCHCSPVLNFQWLFGYSQMSLAFFYSPVMVACGGKANILCVNSQHGTFRSI